MFESQINPSLDGEVLQAGNADVTSPTDYSMLTFNEPGWVYKPSAITNMTHSNATMKFNGKLLVCFILLLKPCRYIDISIWIFEQ